MKKIVIIILILALNCQTKILVSQEINSKLPNAKIIEAVDGFLVYGNTKTQLYVKLYNNNLKIVDSIIQPMHKTSSRSIQVEKLSNGYYFEMKNCRLVIDNKCKKIDFKEWTRETIDSTKNAIGKENMQNYISESGAGFNKNRIYLEDMYIEIIKEYKYMHPFYGYVITESSYKGNPKIRCFTPNNIDVVCTYKFKWEIELKDKKIDDYKWYYFGENQLFLYFSESNYYQAYIYKINYNTGKIEFI
ncbi:MAG: hypothetical protein K9J13_15645, partial [Saprospiraceae bacterium]|nr:hypothetical protein [Saprospiraceae bacterium]